MYFTSSWCHLLCCWNCFIKSFLRVHLQKKPFAKKRLLEKDHSFADDKSRSPHGRCFSVFTFLPRLCPAPSQATLGPFWLFNWLHDSKGRARLKTWCWCVAPSMLKCLMWVSWWHLPRVCCASWDPAFTLRSNSRIAKEETTWGSHSGSWACWVKFLTLRCPVLSEKRAQDLCPRKWKLKLVH